MDDDRKLILFPKTVEYYQVQLTRMLESEQYREAKKLLEFLLRCKGDDPQAQKEWRALLEWLDDQFIHNNSSEETEPEPEKENEMLEQYVQSKVMQSRQYKKKLLEMLFESSSLEKQLLSLEQLAYILDERLAEELVRWLQEKERHPLLQFKGLQVLKQQGATGNVHMTRCGEEVTLGIEKTPLRFEDYPRALIRILAIVRERSEISQPNLSYFAEQTWKEFLSFIYGTSMYIMLCEKADRSPETCAAALHYISVDVMSGPSEPDEILKLYEVSSDEIFEWEFVCQMLKNFVRRAFQPENEKF